MNEYISEAWKYFRNSKGTFSITPEGRETLIVEVMSECIEDAEVIAKFIASSPEMYAALIDAVEALRATEVFMRILDPETADHLYELVRTFDELLDRIEQ